MIKFKKLISPIIKILSDFTLNIKMILKKHAAEKALIKTLPNDIKMLSNFFQMDGKKLYLVGGCIRDTFLGRVPKDYDVCTDALPDDVISILKRNNITYQLMGEHFGVVVAKMSEGDYEIASFRADTKVEGDNRHPDVKHGVTMEDDARRRDITMNALFMDLQDRKIIDIVGGIEDLINGIVRCVGVPAMRFDEDHLRKLRVIRFATRFGFVIHQDTMDAMKLNPELNISEERIVGELTNMINTCLDYDHLIDVLYESKLIYQIFKSLIVNERNELLKHDLKSLNLFVASIVCPCNTDISKKLHEKTYSVKTVESVLFLHDCKAGKFVNPKTFFNKRRSTGLTDDEISIYNNRSKNIEWLLKFELDSTLSEMLIAKGLRGKELGDALNDIYIDAYSTYCKNI